MRMREEKGILSSLTRRRRKKFNRKTCLKIAGDCRYLQGSSVSTSFWGKTALVWDFKYLSRKNLHLFFVSGECYVTFTY